MSIYTIGLTIILYIVTGISCCRQRDFAHAVMWFSYGMANGGLLWYEMSKLKEG